MPLMRCTFFAQGFFWGGRKREIVFTKSTAKKNTEHGPNTLSDFLKTKHIDTFDNRIKRFGSEQIIDAVLLIFFPMFMALHLHISNAIDFKVFVLFFLLKGNKKM